MRCLTLFLALSGLIASTVVLAEEIPDVLPKLPATAAKSRKEFDTAIVDAAKAQEAAVKKAALKFVEELKTLKDAATKAAKLEDAVSLRDAIKVLEETTGRDPLPKVFLLDADGGRTLTISGFGYRWNDWATNSYGPWQFSPSGGLICRHAAKPGEKLYGKVWGQVMLTSDRTQAIWWVPGEPPLVLKVRK